jgi:hypothetical protein
MVVTIRPTQPEASTRRHRESTPAGADAVLRRNQCAIRSYKNHVTTWYSSEGAIPITVASLAGSRLSHPIQVGDLFVHLCEAGNEAQIFIREDDVSATEGNRRWKEIQLGYQHPLLSTHNLTLTPSGDLSWVRRQTITTYAGRCKQKGRMSSGTA